MSVFSMEKGKTRDTFKTIPNKKTSKIAFFSTLSWAFCVALRFVSSTSVLHLMKFLISRFVFTFPLTFSVSRDRYFLCILITDMFIGIYTLLSFAFVSWSSHSLMMSYFFCFLYVSVVSWYYISFLIVYGARLLFFPIEWFHQFFFFKNTQNIKRTSSTNFYVFLSRLSSKKSV